MLFTAASIKGVGGDDQPLRQLPDLPEFQNAWIRSSWRLCHFIRHYNVRAVTINELLGDATMGEEEVKAAKRMAALLDRERPRLLRIKRALQDLHGEKSVAFRDLACHNQRLARDDLFGDHKRSFAPVEWLTLPYGKLLKVEVVQQLRDDLDVIANVKEVDVTVLDKRFAELERAERARLAKEREAEEKAAREKEAAAKEGKEEAKGPEST
jgi:flagellar biosynthesis/type III secretory pathway chaperone